MSLDRGFFICTCGEFFYTFAQKNGYIRKLIIDPHYCHRDEFAELVNYLKENSWDVTKVNPLDKIVALTKDERDAILAIISYVIGKRENDEACDFGYTGLLNLKNKLYD